MQWNYTHLCTHIYVYYNRKQHIRQVLYDDGTVSGPIRHWPRSINHHDCELSCSIDLACYSQRHYHMLRNARYHW